MSRRPLRAAALAGLTLALLAGPAHLASGADPSDPDGSSRSAGGPSDPDPETPETTIESGPDGIVLRGRAGFVAASSLRDSTFSCTVAGEPEPCADGRLRLRGLGAGTYEIAVAATSPRGVTDPTPATRRITVPVDDREMRQASGRWRERSDEGAFRGTERVADGRRDTLRVEVRAAESLELIAGQTPRSGKVRVYLESALLRVVDLAGPRRDAQPFSVTRFANAADGDIRIVARGRKPVRIDGLAVVGLPPGR